MEDGRRPIFRSHILWDEYCGRCKGTLILDIDGEAGLYKSCIQCGSIVYLGEGVRKHTDSGRYREGVLVGRS